jgi:ribonuclease HII
LDASHPDASNSYNKDVSDGMNILCRKPVKPHYEIERNLKDQGWQRIAGVDEAGRGPLAGPVIAAAVILDHRYIPDGLDDSKKLGAKQREFLFENILATAHIGWCAVSANNIDRINIRQATLRAMHGAISCLSEAPDAMLVDGRDIPPGFTGKAQAVIGGDAISQSIAAASIVAKIVRDRIMQRADNTFPGYGFARHMGYGTAFHLQQLKNLGPCSLHRKSYAPVAAILPEHIR